MQRLLSLVLVALFLVGCGDAPKERVVQSPKAKPAGATAVPEAASVLGGQRGNGMPYEIVGSEVWDVPDPVSGRNYQVFVAVPRSYVDNPERHYPVLYVTDADYAFPLVRQIGRRLNLDSQKIDDFILVGLSYATGETGASSRRRDYTPTPNGPKGAPPEAIHGKAGAYSNYLRDQVLPFVARRYRTDESRRLFLGHSYGSLLGTQILLSEPKMFAGYILGSPSYWYDNHYMEGMESSYAANHKDLRANVYMYVGQYEETKPGDSRYATERDMVSDAQTMEKRLRSRNYPSLHLKLDVLDDEDHLSIAPRGFTHGLEYLLGTKPH